MNKKKNYDKALDWKDWQNSGFPYRGVSDPQYIKERKAFLHTPDNKDAPYNGWWWFKGLRRSETGQPKKKKDEDKK